jgi:hypothetical protein
MALIEGLLGLLFGGNRNLIKETAGVFLPNAEAAATRDAIWQGAVLQQFSGEFAAPKQGWFDRVMDGLNRLPRPALALGTLGLFVAAMVDPLWFTARMQGLALVPQPLWWLMGAIVSFYFGARQQMKTQQFQQALAETLLRSQPVMQNLARIAQMQAGADAAAEANPALVDWQLGAGAQGDDG